MRIEKYLFYKNLSKHVLLLNVKGLVTQSCLTLCDPMDCSSPGSSVRGISRARILEWLPFPSPGDLPDPQIELMSPALTGRFFTTEPPGKPCLSLPSWRFTYK